MQQTESGEVIEKTALRSGKKSEDEEQSRLGEINQVINSNCF